MEILVIILILIVVSYFLDKFVKESILHKELYDKIERSFKLHFNNAPLGVLSVIQHIILRQDISSNTKHYVLEVAAHFYQETLRSSGVEETNEHQQLWYELDPLGI